MTKRLCVIINPKSGTGKPSKVLQGVKELLDSRPIEYKLKVVHTPDETSKATKNINPELYDALAIYGGDGTVVAAFKAIYNRPAIPVLLLPGGSANALAGSLGVPADIGQCLDLFLGNLYLQRQFGVATVNDKPFILDLHFGVWADSIQETDQATKQKLGQFAYTLQAIKQFRSASKDTYKIRLDGKLIKRQAYACIITNEGFHGVLGVPLFSHSNVPGWLQIAIIKRTSPFALIRWLIIRRLGYQDSSVIATSRAKEIIVEKASKRMFFDDAAEVADLPLVIRSSPHSVTVITPPVDDNSFWRRLKARVRTQPYRFYDHMRRVFTGGPSINTSQVSSSLYVGGQYRSWASAKLSRWGITGVVNMRNLRNPTRSSTLEVLNLPTKDHQPPRLKDLQRGVEFIQRHIENDGSVYVHCRLGEGRGPTMAAAYLISQGMAPRDAVAHIARFRRQSRPNARQLRQLVRFESQLASRNQQ